MIEKTKANQRVAWLGICVVILVASSLRSPITVVSPILDEIKTALHLNNIQGSLLTSIPLIVFAACSILVSKATAKVDIRYGLIYSLIILIVGLCLRVYGNVTMLYIGSLILGLGICIGNVLTPAYIKDIFPSRIGIMTGIFSVSMCLVAALASGFSIAIGQWTNAGWQGSLGIWTIGALLALFAMVAELFGGSYKPEKKVKIFEKTNFNVFRSKQAWNISIFMGVQSLVYYCLVALLPTILIDYGMSKMEAGWVLSALQLAMLPVMLFSPVLATKMKDPKILIYITGVLYISGILMLVILKTQYIYLGAVLMGIAGGLAFSLSILFFSLRSKTMEGTLKISGKAQSIGYLIASLGPPVFGKLHDWDFSWRYSLYFLILNIVIMTFFGRRASKPRFIEEY